MQRGTIYRHRNCWYLRFYESDIVGGVAVRKRSCRKLASIEDYPRKRDVLLLAEKILSPINTNQSQPEAALRVVDFIESIYLPHVQKTLKASTYKDYSKDVYEKHLKSRLGELRLRDFRTVHGQKILTAVTVGGVGHKTGLRIKSFLSGSFKHAKRLGYIDGENPIRDVAVPGKPVRFKGEVYGVDEIELMLISLPQPARTIVAVAALTGLRLSEIRGLRWGDFDGSTLQIRRRVWRTNVDTTKTEASTESVPVLPLLQKTLVSHKERVKPTSDEAYIFAGERRGAPLHLANLVRRVIMPALAKIEPPLEAHWKGWHAFRRGLATNLYSMGVSPKVIQAILRHSDIGTTLSFYVQPPKAETRGALSKMEEAFPFGL